MAAQGPAGQRSHRHDESNQPHNLPGKHEKDGSRTICAESHSLFDRIQSCQRIVDHPSQQGQHDDTHRNSKITAVDRSQADQDNGPDLGFRFRLGTDGPPHQPYSHNSLNREQA
jgi:hypothetical protein